MKTLALAVAALALLPAAARAADKPNPLAAKLCSIELKLGAAVFTAKYGAGAAGQKACLRVNAARTASLTKTCTAASTPGSCLNAADRARFEKAKRACLADWNALGKKGFAAKWGVGKAGGIACLKSNA